MKNNKVFRVLAIAIVLSLLVMALPAASALAAESLRVSPSTGEVGDEVDVSGSGYDEGERVYIYFSNEEAEEGDDVDSLDAYEEVETTTASSLTITDDGGDIDTTFDVPDELTDGSDTVEVTGGVYYVYTTYDKEGEILALDDFTIMGITGVDPTEGTVGTEVDITGAGFADSETIEAFYDDDEIEIASGDDETDKKGEFELTIVIPDSASGEHDIRIEIDKDEAETTFTVEPESSISTTSGRIGDKVTITGTGFGASADVTVKFDGNEVTTGTTGSDGKLSINFNVPAVGAGKYDVEVKDDDGNSGKFSFTMTTDISVGPVTSQTSPGYLGMDITISGTGFKPKTTVTITYASTPVVFTTQSEDDGSFSYTFKIPKSDPGEHTITATDGVNSLEVDFFMESEAPEIPQPVSPAMDTKPEIRPITFDWQNVTDPSGVTYTFQIAKDKSFSNIVLTKEGLTKSEYTMSVAEDEALESTKKDAPYWWRVKAIDGVGNDSGWTGAGSFHVGFSFEMPKWVIYLLIGLGGVALFFIGFFIGRRTGYAY